MRAGLLAASLSHGVFQVPRSRGSGTQPPIVSQKFVASAKVGAMDSRLRGNDE